MIRIYSLNCGKVGVDPAVPDRSISKNKLAYTGLFRNPRNRLWLPVKAFYIDYPGKKILVDTGWDQSVRTHPVSALSFPLWLTSKPYLPKGAAVDERLAALGVKPDDLDDVIMTHMDIDHDSGLKLVKDAKRILVSPEEWKAIHSDGIRYAKGPWKNIHLEQIPFQKDSDAPYGQAWDMMGDQKIIIYAMPGHTQGSIVIKVQTEKEFVLIVGDTGYNRASWEQLKISGPVYNVAEMRKSLAWVQNEARKPECRAVLAAHDPEEQRNIIELEK